MAINNRQDTRRIGLHDAVSVATHTLDHLQGQRGVFGNHCTDRTQFSVAQVEFELGKEYPIVHSGQVFHDGHASVLRHIKGQIDEDAEALARLRENKLGATGHVLQTHTGGDNSPFRFFLRHFIRPTQILKAGPDHHQHGAGCFRGHDVLILFFLAFLPCAHAASPSPASAGALSCRFI